MTALPPLSLQTDGQPVEIDGKQMFRHVGWDGEIHFSDRPTLYWARSLPFDLDLACNVDDHPTG